jgi:hypothetical protein
MATRNGFVNVGRQDRIRFLVRKNVGHRQLPELLRDLGRTLGHEVPAQAALPLEESDGLFKAARLSWSSLLPSIRRWWLPTAESECASALLRLAQKLVDSEVLYFGTSVRTCGGIRLPLRRCLEHAVQLIRLDGNDLFIMNPSLTDGVCLEWVEDWPPDAKDETAARVWYYDLSVRGKNWGAVAGGAI